MRFLLSFFLLASAFQLSSQSWTEKIDSLLKLDRRPKIGLALSGGGAHGLAHIGVIKYLEERNIPVDYITGTSIGAIVGGMYALGYSFEDMEEIVKKYNWAEIVANTISLIEVESQEKQFHNKIPFSLRIEKSKILLPEAFFEGYKLDLKVQEIYSAAFLADDFSKLPRQFKCYSVDLLSGTLFEHSSGSLAEAIRASMAIPSIFTPVRRDSMLLVDGGLMKNFPAQEVKDMGADIVIGVYVGSKRGKLEDINSMADILKLTGFLTSNNDTEIQKTKCDILIQPDVKDFPILDFNKYEELKEIGYEAAYKNGEKIDEISHLLSHFSEEQPLFPLRIPNKLFLEDVKVSPADENYSDLIYDEFEPLIKTNISIAEYNEALNYSFSTKNIDNVKVRLEEGGLGQIINVNYTVKKESKIGIAINHFDNINTSVILSGNLRNVLLPKTNVMGFIRIGENSGIKGLIYRRMGKRNKLLIKGDFHILKFNDPIFIKDLGKKELNYYEFKMGVGLRLIKGLHSSYTFNYSILNRNLQPKELREIDIRDFDQNLQKIEVVFDNNTLNNWAYPNSGNWTQIKSGYLYNIRQEVSYTVPAAENIYGVPNNTSNFSLQLTDKRYYPLSEYYVLESYVSYGIYTEYSLVDYFRIGGTDTYSDFSLPFIGATQGEYRMQHYFYLQQALRYEIANNLYLKIVGNFLRGKSYNTKYLDINDNIEWESIFGMGLSIGHESVIGPVNINFGYKSDLSEFNFSVGVGYRHIL